MDDQILIHNARILTPNQPIENGWLLVENGHIALIGTGNPPEFTGAQQIDARGLIAMPGMIDVHVHGSNGYECMDGDAESVRQMARFFAQNGVTGFTPSTWTASAAEIHTTLKTIAELEGPQANGATIIGAHLEGPYLNPARAGAQNPHEIRRAPRDEALAFLDYNTIKLVALAPEYEENYWLIDECVRRGVTVSAAHTTATYQQMVKAVEMGVTQTTHTFNAMTGLHHREPGTIGAAMTLDQLCCELICDNVHVHPVSQKVLYTAKGPNRIALITDAVRGAGLKEGTMYGMDQRTVTVRDGASYLPDNTLAGSTLLMNRGLHNFIQATGETLDTLWPTSSLNIARNLNIAHRTGSLEVGKDADVILVDPDINVFLTVARGTIVYRKDI